MARGSILERDNKNGTTTYSIKFRTGDGTQIKRAIGPNRREAEAALSEALVAVNKGALCTTSQERFAQAAERWLARKQVRIEASTFRDYETHLRLRLMPAFGEMQLRRITRAHIERYLADTDRDGTLSRKTLNDSLIPLRQILARAVTDGVLAVNPAVSADRDDPLELPYEPPTMLYLDRDQVHRYLDATPAWYLPLAETLIGAGLRVGEAIALRWKDIAWDANAITISRTAKTGGIGTPKGDRARSVMVAGYLVEILEAHRDRQANSAPDALIFRSPRGAMLDRNNVRNRGHIVTLRDAGLPVKVRLHDLRHTAATLWLASGQSIYFVQQQLGHQDIQTTIGLYGHPDQEAHRQAANAAAAWWR